MYEGKQIDWYVTLVTLSVLVGCGFVGFLKCLTLFSLGGGHIVPAPTLTNYNF